MMTIEAVEVTEFVQERKDMIREIKDKVIRKKRCKRKLIRKSIGEVTPILTLQKLFLSCQAAFKGHGTVPSSNDVNNLLPILDVMRPEDVGLSRDLQFFKPKEVVDGNARVTYTTIYQCENFSLCIFFLPATAAIPLHNHPGMTVFSKLLLGTMHIKSYDWVDPVHHHPSDQISTPKSRLARMKANKIFRAPCDTSVLYPTSGGNIHEFRAITPCAVLDVIGPPYSKDDGRDCSYYKDTPCTTLSEEEEDKGASYGWLEEIEMPEESEMDVIQYLGPQVIMGERLDVRHTSFLAAIFMIFSISYSETLQSSQQHILLNIQYLLNFPVLARNHTDFCNLQPTSSLTVVCYDKSVTQLLINGRKDTDPDTDTPLLLRRRRRLPDNFSVDSFITTLSKLPDLKVLKLVSLGLWGQLPNNISRLSSLEILDLSSNFLSGEIPSEISSLTKLQALILDDNTFSGRLPNGLTLLSILAVLSVKNNSFTGPLPDSLGKLENLRILALSNNNFSGEFPDLRNVENLQVLDLGNNSLGPRFPSVTSKIGRLVLRMNKFSYGIPEKLQSYYQLQHLDISSNRFVGPFPTFLLSMPSITYLNIASNRFTGMLFQDSACSSELKFVNLSSNLLAGTLPSCLQSMNKVVQYSGNCLATGDRSQQHPISFCQNEALAVGIIPHSKRGKQSSTLVLALSISASVVGGILLVGLILILVRKFLAKEAPRSKKPTRIIEEDASTKTGYSSKILSDARYITQAMKIGGHGLPPYRTFTLEELEQATNNFDTSSFMGKGTHGQMYRGQLRDGSFVAIRCLKLKRSHSAQSLMHHIEMMSKLRHHHLVSTLGHCFEYYLDDSSVSRIFLIFEYVPNGNLRRWTSEKRGKRVLTWSQRISAAIGVAKGIQFLHTGIVPGIYANYVKITDVLLDQNLIAKISSYSLPLLTENIEQDTAQKITPGTSKEPKNTRAKHREKFDIPDFGVILMEIISGKPMNSKNAILVLKDQLQLSITADAASRKRVVDPAISVACSDESLKTMIGICCRCLLTNPAERPSIEDVLWNLHFAAQVQDAALRSDSQSSDSSPVSAFQPPRLQPHVPWL